MKIVESFNHPLMKIIKSIKKKKSDLIFLEGIHLCESWIRTNGNPIYALFNPLKLNNLELKNILSLINQENCFSLSIKQLEYMGKIFKDQGVVFLIKPKIHQILIPNKTSILLDRIQDPGNLGTLFRSAVAVGIKNVFLSSGCASAWSSKVLRSGQGAHFFLNILENINLINIIKNSDIPVVSTVINGGDDLYSIKLPEKLLWLFGNEGNGLSENLINITSYKIHIQQEEPLVNSLNVSIAATLCLFEHKRKNIFDRK